MVVRDKQFQVFAAEGEKRFRESLVEHVLGRFPFPAKYLARELLERLTGEATAAAREYGFETEAGLRLFVDCAARFGASFYNDPLLFWLRDIVIDRRDTDKMTKACRMRMHLEHYSSRVYGVNGELALPGLDQFEQTGPVTLTGASGSLDLLLAWLYGLHPEKCDYAGKEALKNLIASSHQEAARVGMRTMKGTVLLTYLEFTFGAGVLSDPLFPWVAASLAEETGPAERIELLDQRTRAYVRRVRQMMAEPKGTAMQMVRSNGRR